MNKINHLKDLQQLAYSLTVGEVKPEQYHDLMMKAVTTLIEDIPSQLKGPQRDVAKLNKTLRTSKGYVSRARFGIKAILPTIINHVQKVQKLNDKVFQKPELKQEVIDHLWVIYGTIETIGLDDDHYSETDIPCNDRQQWGKESESGFIPSLWNHRESDGPVHQVYPTC